MSAPQSFCTQCGQALSPESKFCPKCGKAVGATVPETPQQPQAPPVPQPAQAAPPPQAAQAPAAPQAPQAPPSAPPPAKSAVKGCLGRIGLVLLGILLIAFSLRGPVLGVAGTRTSAVVTGVKQVVNQTSEKMDHNYSVQYRFKAKNGTRYSGSMSMAKVHNTAKLPKKDSLVRIRYLAAWPAINAAEKECGVTFALLLGVVGIVLIVFALKPGKAKS